MIQIQFQKTLLVEKNVPLKWILKICFQSRRTTNSLAQVNSSWSSIKHWIKHEIHRIWNEFWTSNGSYKALVLLGLRLKENSCYSHLLMACIIGLHHDCDIPLLLPLVNLVRSGKFMGTGNGNRDQFNIFKRPQGFSLPGWLPKRADPSQGYSQHPI